MRNKIQTITIPEQAIPGYKVIESIQDQVLIYLENHEFATAKIIEIKCKLNNNQSRKALARLVENGKIKFERRALESTNKKAIRRSVQMTNIYYLPKDSKFGKIRRNKKRN